MKTLKAFIIGIVTLLSAGAAKAQVRVSAHIGTPPPPPHVVVVNRPVHPRTVVVHRPARRHVVIHRPHRYRRVVVRRHYVKKRYYSQPVRRGYYHRY